MLIAVGLLCSIASAFVGAAVQPLDIPKPFRCIKGQKCPIPWPRCPLGQATGRPCRPGYPRCKRGYTCIVGRCCKDRVHVPGKCPTESLMGPVCGIRNSCEFGYTCRRGRCCSNQCPRGMAQGPFCNINQPCKRGYICRKGVCCRKKIIVVGQCPPLPPRTAGICVEECNSCESRGQLCCSNGCGHVCKDPVKPIVPPRGCPFGDMQVPGICLSKRGCPKGSSCYNNICCRRRHIILPPDLPSGKCPFGQIRVPGSCISKMGCPKGSSCYKNTCCRRQIILPPGLPSGKCPFGQIRVPGSCISKMGCPKGSSCYKNTCCRRQIILPPGLPSGKCPFGQIRVPGSCISKMGCPKGSSCYKNTCCRRQIIVPPGLGQCPPVRPGTVGTCVERCNNCESIGQLCCSNGCGHVCKDPVKPILPPRGCPFGQMQVPGICLSKKGCPKGSSCYNNKCCRRRHIILPPDLPPGKCPVGQTRVPGSCISKMGCPEGSSCYRNTCCRRHIILPPGLGQCPPLPPRTVGICAELCNNCESRGQLCCSNGCGHVCKDPVKPVKPIVPPGKCPLGQMRVPGSCISMMGCPKGSSCYKNTCCRRHFTLPPGRDGFCPGGAAPPKFPICPLLRPKLPSSSCTSDKQCRKTEKCCKDYCGRRRCRTALPFPPP